MLLFLVQALFLDIFEMAGMAHSSQPPLSSYLPSGPPLNSLEAQILKIPPVV